MLTKMKSSRRNLVLFSSMLIILLRGRGTESVSTKIIKAQTVQLKPMSYRINDDAHLLKMNLQSRQDVCSRLLSEMTSTPILYSTDKNKHVPPAHLYEINGQHLLAIRCPSLPATYISRDEAADQWYIRVLDPPIDQYKFNFEVADDVNLVTNDRDLTDNLKAETEFLLSMEAEKRLRLCAEAAKLVRYGVEWDKHTRFAQPRFYSFTYSMGTETYLACRCDMVTINKRYLFIRSDHSSESNRLTIVLSNGNDALKGQELNSEVNVTNTARSFQ